MWFLSLILVVIIIMIVVISLYFRQSKLTLEKKQSSSSIGIIVLRHVHSKESNRFWNMCIRHIRKYYPLEVPIVIVDDNSIQEFVECEETTNMSNITIISSSFEKGRGELLPFLYFHHFHWFEKALILHDSVFLQSFLNISNIEDVSFVWCFYTHQFDNVQQETRLLSYLQNKDLLLQTYESPQNWFGVFGAMVIISHAFLDKLESAFSFTGLSSHIKSRTDRMCWERILAVMIFSLKQTNNVPVLFGEIYRHQSWGTQFDFFMTHPSLFASYPIIKTWSGR